MSSPLIDTHTHLEGFFRAGQLDGVLERAREAGVEAMITIGTGPDDWALYQELARLHPGVVYHAVGLHPCSVDAGWAAAVALLEAGGGDGPAPVAIGETGLDRFHLPKDAAVAEQLFGWQKASFREHLRIARAWELPVVVHSRAAALECIGLIDAAGFPWERVVFHCFSEGPTIMRELIKRGGRGSFGGVATYKNASTVRESAVLQGLERLMLETDAPYLTPEPLRGRGNEPAYIAHTAVALARAFAVPEDEFRATTTRVARGFFGI